MEISFKNLKGKKFAVAVSGGSDSMALLNLLIDNGFSDYMTVLHFDHNLRKESELEANWLRKYLQKVDVNAVFTRWDSPDKNGNLQQAARKARYAFFKKVCEYQKLDFVLVGHTMDDVAETFLMRLARGSGLKGLSSMQEESNALGVQVMRPLLHVGREDLQNYLTQKNVEYLSDPSNQNEKFFRIRIRKLKTILLDSGLSYQNIRESALSLRRSDDALEYYTTQQFNLMFDTENKTLPLDVLHQPLEIQLRLLERAILFMTGDGLAPRTSKRLRALKGMAEGEKYFTLGGVKFTLKLNRYLLELE